MALVNCPECGRKNVSDTAVGCPDCGFEIKDYFDRIKLEEKRLAEEKALKEKYEAEKRLKLETLKEKQDETILRLENQIKNSSKGIIISAIILLFSLALTILCWSSSDDDAFLGILFWAAITFFSAVFLISGISENNTAQSDLETAKKSFEEYEKKVEARRAAELAYEKAKQTKYAAQHPKCPICGSANTERISTLNRTVSVATVGLASSKIGKQYECKNCKHKW